MNELLSSSWKTFIEWMIGYDVRDQKVNKWVFDLSVENSFVVDS